MISFDAAFGNYCVPSSGSDSYDGTATFSPDAGRTTGTKGYVYKGGVLVVRGTTPGKLEVAGLSVTQSSTDTVLDGTTTIDGHVMTCTRERVQ